MKNIGILTLNTKNIRDFAKARNDALAKMKEPWILMLDSDEKLSPELERALPDLIKNPEIDGYWFRRKNFYSPTEHFHYGLFYPDYQLKLFRNWEAYRFTGRVHEKLDIPKEKTKEMKLDIFHFPKPFKYLSWQSVQESGYIDLLTKEHVRLNELNLVLLWRAIYSFFDMFFMGLIRGKGILDGWVGVKAHFYFALSISLSYWYAFRTRVWS